MIRNDWTIEEIQEIYNSPLLELVFRAASTHRQYNNTGEVQVCTLLSIKTGGCSEDCGYCAQSARYSTGVKAERLMTTEAILETARRARENGSTRFCMGAAWKGVRDGDPRFEQVLESIREVAKLGMEVCVTLGQLGDAEAHRAMDWCTAQRTEDIVVHCEDFAGAAEEILPALVQFDAATLAAVQQCLFEYRLKPLHLQ